MFGRVLVGAITVGLMGMGCGESDPDDPVAPTGGPSVALDELDFAEVALQTPDTPAGFVDFYLGEAVVAEHAATGTFEPTEDKAYSRVRVPTAMLAQLVEQGEPVTWSLCDAAHGIELFHQAVAPIYRAPEGVRANCTPWVQEYDGRMTIRYTSGQPGVFGRVVLHEDVEGRISVGAIMNGRLPADQEACPGDRSVGNSGMALGHVVEDDVPEDEAVPGCVAPDVDGDTGP
ncbi:MAG: hypothetical protein H6733_17955 [Alphaproteobacteria bacterium]|nr:hypothetical protein [Alphaproteobacteria bacterium]